MYPLTQSDVYWYICFNADEVRNASLAASGLYSCMYRQYTPRPLYDLPAPACNYRKLPWPPVTMLPFVGHSQAPTASMPCCQLPACSSCSGEAVTSTCGSQHSLSEACLPAWAACPLLCFYTPPCQAAPRPPDAAGRAAEALATVRGWSWGIEQAVRNTCMDAISRSLIRDR